MRGHVRHRGEGSWGGWEYIVDIGMAAAQRCTVCNKRVWIERRPVKSCPKCGGTLMETDERRRAIKSGFATQKECQAAMNKLLVAVEQHNYSAPTKASVKDYLTKEWLPAVKSTIRPTTYNSYVQLVECHIVPHIGTVKLQKLSGSQVNALYAKLAETGRKDAKSGLSPMTIHHVHACLHKACKDAARWGHISRNPLDAADPPRKKGDGTKKMKTWTKEQLKAFLAAVADERLSPLWHTIAMTGMRRGEALGLRWSDVDLENSRLSVRRALVPVSREVVVSEPKTVKGRRVVALDPGTVEVLKAQAARQLDEQHDWAEAWVESGLVFTAENGPPSRRTRPRNEAGSRDHARNRGRCCSAPQCLATVATRVSLVGASRRQNVGSLADSEGMLPNAPARKRTVLHHRGAPGWNRTSDTR